MKASTFVRNVRNVVEDTGIASPGGVTSEDRAAFPEMLKASVGDPYPRDDKRWLAWVTDTEEVLALHGQHGGLPSPGLAAAVRNMNGLAHLIPKESRSAAPEDVYLLELRIPSADLVTANLRRPTFIDGAESLLFRSKCADDGWGRTINLKPRADGSCEDGACEAVHGKTTITDDFEIHDLGPVGRLLACPDDAALQEATSRPWCSGCAAGLAKKYRL